MVRGKDERNRSGREGGRQGRREEQKEKEKRDVMRGTGAWREMKGFTRVVALVTIRMTVCSRDLLSVVMVFMSW